MADAKDLYSETSSVFVNNDAVELEEAKKIYESSKEREARHNEEWKKNPVNINDIVDRFAPGSAGERANGKYIYRGDRFNVVTDMAAGYLRVYDTETKRYVKLDGTPAEKNDATHFKIKRREEM